MRIAYFHYLVTPENPAGGSELYWLESLARDHHVTVFSLEFRPRRPCRAEWVRIRATRRPLFLLFLTFHALAPLAYGWHRLARGVAFDLVHTVESNSLLGDVVSVHFCHTAYLNEHWVWNGNVHLRGICRWIDHKLHALLEPMAFRRARALVVPSQGLARELLRYWPELSPKIRVIPHPFDVEHYTVPADFNRQAERLRLGFTDRDLVLCFVALGHFERKGLPALLSAMQRLTQLPVRLLVVGGHPATLKPYRQMVAAHGLCPKVVFTGQVSDPRPYLWCSDGLILPSVYETFSKVCFEAAACGLPILATRLHGVEELLEDGVNGFFLEPEPASIASTIERFVGLSAEKRKSMGLRARQAVLGYSVQAYLERWNQVLAEMGLQVGEDSREPVTGVDPKSKAVPALARPGREEKPC